jgi:hypothetical protein
MIDIARREWLMSHGTLPMSSVIRAMSAAHSRAELDHAIDAFVEVGRDMGFIQ